MNNKIVRGKMSREDRAKQFMPFSALKGHREALKAQEKIIVPKIEISEEYAEELDRKLRQIKRNDIITVVYFYKGEYLKQTGMASRIDETAKILRVVNTKISFEDIYDIDILSK